MGPSLASIKISTPSTMRSGRSTSPPKSAWPGVDDVNLHTLIRHTRVLGTDGDAPLTFLIHGIHDAFAHVVDLAMDMCLT